MVGREVGEGPRRSSQGDWKLVQARVLAEPLKRLLRYASHRADRAAVGRASVGALTQHRLFTPVRLARLFTPVRLARLFTPVRRARNRQSGYYEMDHTRLFTPVRPSVWRTEFA